MDSKIRIILFTALYVFGLMTTLKAQIQIPKDSATGKYSYQGIIKVDSANKQELYSKAKTWVLRTLKSSDNMIELDDKDYSTIIGSGTIIMNNAGYSGMLSYSFENGKLNFKVIFQFKDGKVKYTFDNFSYSANKVFNVSYKEGEILSPLENLDLNKKAKEQVLQDASTKMNTIVSSFTSEILTTKNKPKDDW
jgi:hypothetical protein